MMKKNILVFLLVAKFVWISSYQTVWSSRAPQTELKVFFGNLHSHTSYSDGSGTPEQAYKRARDVGGLDFLAITEHNHSQAELGASQDRKDGILVATNTSLYNGQQSTSLIKTASRYTQPGKFIALYGQEFNSISKGNHVNVFDVPKIIDVANGEFDDLLQWLQDNPDTTDQPAIIQFNHPGENDDKDPERKMEYGADDFGGEAGWLEKMGQRASLIELLNGPAMSKTNSNRSAKTLFKDYLRYLQLGFHLAPTGDQDNHYLTWGTVTETRTGVIADELTKPKLLAALRARHVYATEDKNLKIIFRINGNLCGDRAENPQNGSQLRIEYRIEDKDEPNAGYRIDVFSGVIGQEPAAIVNTVSKDGNTQPGVWETIEDVTYNGGAQYVFFRITQEGEDFNDRAWTSPVWFDLNSNLLINNNSELTQLVASKKSSIYHTSPECRAAKSIKDSNLITGSEAIKNRTKHENCPLK